MDIKQILKERFSKELKENYKRRIIFWKDPDRQFYDDVDSCCPDEVKLLKLTGYNNFSVKYILSELDESSDYLVYDPLSYSDVKQDWLIDIELYSEEFRADLVSMRMQQLGIIDNVELRKVVKDYGKFFDNKERLSKFASLDKSINSVGKFYINVLTVLVNAESNTVSSIIKSVLYDGLDMDDNVALGSIRKYASENVFWKLVERYCGYSSEQPSLLNLACYLLLTALSATMDDFKGFDRYVSISYQQPCYTFVDEWMKTNDSDKYLEVARIVEEKVNLADYFDSLEVNEIINSDLFPCIDESLLKRFASEISENVIKSDDILKVYNSRKSLKWFDSYKSYYVALQQVSLMHKFYLAHSNSFYVAEYKKLWNDYCSELYKMDTYYRLFHVSFSEILNDSNTLLDDQFKNVADYVENLYKNWFLANLSSKWINIVSDQFKKDYCLSGLVQQIDFYKKYVKPIVENKSRAFVIISDALRYEVAKELTDQLVSETKGIASVSSMQAIFPSVTMFGMAALLPCEKLEYADGKLLCDGLSTDGTNNREKILNKYHSGDVAIQYEGLLRMKQKERRELIASANVVYIYHNSIDALGDKADTEREVFAGCQKAISDIKNIVRIISGDMNGTNILITADHGFLYSYNPLKESDKAEKDYVSGDIVEYERRYVLAKSDSNFEHMVEINMNHVNSDLIGLTPLENIRMKKQGGGNNYVHGGISLQEIVVPLIEYRKLRSDSKQFVDVKKASIALISQSRKISNSIFTLDFYQKEAVSGKVISNQYDIYMSDVSGKIVSDIKTIIADKTETTEIERQFKVRLTLKSLEFKKTDTYYLKIVDKETKNIVDSFEYMIDIAFVNDFDF